MNPKHLFVDERLTGMCVYCGGPAETRDHVPSRVLLDEPYPPNLPVVEACASCNASFAKDEQYVACLVECVISGSVEPNGVRRDKINRILADNPALTARVRTGRQKDDGGNLTWNVEGDRVRHVLLKLARGHAAYELSLPQLGEPDYVCFIPFASMSVEQRASFESPSGRTPRCWPELGSRAFIRTVKNYAFSQPDEWTVVAPERYRYLVDQSGGLLVQMVLSEYLACRILWD